MRGPSGRIIVETLSYTAADALRKFSPPHANHGWVAVEVEINLVTK